LLNERTRIKDPTFHLCHLSRSFDEPAGCVSDWREHASDIWLKYRGKFASVHEQVLVQEDGYRITLLTLGDEQEEGTSWQRPNWR
jgi:hypothetical protein